MLNKRFKQFYFFIFFTALIPLLPFILPFIPNQLFGFNWTGWAWITMLFVTVINLPRTKKNVFPIWTWLPWIIYLLVYIAVDYSFQGLQLTFQYILPLLIGIVASSFNYSEENLLWLFKWLKRICIVLIAIFAFGQLFLNGYTPTKASTPMILSIGASLLAGMYFLTKTKKYLLYFGLLFLVPVIDVTRMGIAVFLSIFILHFANRKISGKILYGLAGLILVVIVFNTKGFQEKTFYEGQGKLSDLSFNYYENTAMNNNGRASWQKALESGLKAKPIFGNGPRADNEGLKSVSGWMVGEAHNDYLSVRYNYGYIGLSFLLFGFATNFVIIWRLIRYLPNTWSELLGTSTLTLFISFLMFMYSDNILKYTIFFPDFFFAMIGIIFSIHKNGWKNEVHDTINLKNSITQ